MMNSDERSIAPPASPAERLAPEVAALEAKQQELQTATATLETALSQMVQDSLASLETRRQTLDRTIEQLERRQERIQTEMRTSFAGSSQEVAVRVQSFKDYLLGSLQDLVVAADRLELVRPPEPMAGFQSGPSASQSAGQPSRSSGNPNLLAISDLTFAASPYDQKADRIRQVIELFRSEPDYYGPAWKLRRTFEPLPAERTADWFFTQGGRGAVRSLGSRLQNILVSSAIISILYNLYGDKLRPMVLANSPERLGEWRRGLQDCLGLTRNDFGADRGPALFESAEPLVQRAERCQQEGKLPLIIIDEMEESVSLGVLQFPLWLAFAPIIPAFAAPTYSNY
jgi:Protein of unknown function (DUF3086)